MGTRQKYLWSRMTVGVCYYPEHWDRKLWREDLQRMKKAGITVIRIGEFSWNVTEPEEGVFSYAFFEEFLGLCLEEGMEVIFGTPTATPPSWLTKKYPEVLNCREDGVAYRHGARRHYNYNSPKYQELSGRIVTKLAEHFGKHPAIVGWQIDNELNCETAEFYSDADTRAFREFLKEKYGSLEQLNKAWGTAFWNQTYTDWEEIEVPGVVLGNGYNPHRRLDYYRFISESAIRFCRMQAEIIRRYKKPEDFVTTNGMFWNLNNHRMQRECLDVYTYDSYPSFAFGLDRDPVHSTDLNDRHWTKNLTEVRSICPHFGIMEQQSGANGWVTRMEGPAPRPGQLTLWAMQSVAQGADFISFFRWRTCTFGTEMYWHGILDYDNRDNRKLAEVTAFAEKMKKLSEVCQAENVAAFGLLKDYDNVWDTNTDVWHERVHAYSEEQIFEISELTHTPYNVIYLEGDTTLADLSGYPVLVYPHPVIMTNERAELLKSYVEQGGTLIIGCRAGYKDGNGHCVMMPQPGLLAELTGSDVEEFTFVSKAEEEIFADWNGHPLPVPMFHDVMSVSEREQTKVLAVYQGGYYKGKAALIEKRLGKGRTLHLGSAFCRENVRMLLDYTGVLEPFAETVEAPEGVEVVMRRKEGQEFLFLLNFQNREERVLVKKEGRCLESGETVQGELWMKAFETRILKL